MCTGAEHGKPYSGKYFIREGASSQQMLREEIREFFYAEGLIHFDETPCRKFSLESDLDNENWVLFRQRAKIPENMEPEIALRNLHLIGEDGHMTQAGAWLLAQDIGNSSQCRLGVWIVHGDHQDAHFGSAWVPRRRLFDD